MSEGFYTIQYIMYNTYGTGNGACNCDVRDNENYGTSIKVGDDRFCVIVVVKIMTVLVILKIGMVVEAVMDELWDDR